MSTAKAPAAPSGRICEKKYIEIQKNNVVEYLESRHLKPAFNFICVG